MADGSSLNQQVAAGELKPCFALTPQLLRLPVSTKGRFHQPIRKYPQENPRQSREARKISANEWRKNQGRKRNCLWSFDWLTTRLRIFWIQCWSGTPTIKFLLDNKRLRDKMWYKVVESGKCGRVRGS